MRANHHPIAAAHGIAAHAAIAFGLAGAVAAVTAAPPARWDDDQVIREATGGRLTKPRGSFVDEACQTVDYDATVVDLNGDGQPEVFTQVHGTCVGGMAGVHMNLYIKDKRGQWQAQFGFPGIALVKKTRNKGFPDIEIGGPGTCFPLWRWNGRKYILQKGCVR